MVRGDQVASAFGGGGHACAAGFECRSTLQEFKALDDNYGDDPVGCTLAGTDPLLGRYDDELAATTRAGFFVTPLDQLLADHPFPPAAAHEARSAKA